MPNIRDTAKALQGLFAPYKVAQPTRVAVLGDGRGYATSNVIVPTMENYVFARETHESRQFFPVLNRSTVTPQINLPVMLGYSDSEPNIEQVLGINYAGLGTISASAIASAGPHHTQHQFRGGDEVFIDSRLILPGLVHPTNPPTMTVVVEAFNYFWNGWKRFSQTTTDNLAQYKPGGSFGTYVLIALDPETGSLIYHDGLPFDIGFSTTIPFTNAPSGAGHELPLGFVFLSSLTASISWTLTQDNIVDARQHVLPNLQYVNDRLRQLEGYTGNDPNLATTGAAASTVDAHDKTLGGLTNVNTTGASDWDTLTFDNPTARWLPKNSQSVSTTASPTFASVRMTDAIRVSEYANGTMGLATLVGGNTTVSNIRVTANTRIFMTAQASGANIGTISIGDRSPGANFRIDSTNVLDERAVAWLLVEP